MLETSLQTAKKDLVTWEHEDLAQVGYIRCQIRCWKQSMKTKQQILHSLIF